MVTRIAERSLSDKLAEEVEDVPAPVALEVPEALSILEQRLPADRFLDRRVSWLRFNQRVLDLACDPNVPLLERVRFLAIFASNLDEFFMVRVAGLLDRIEAGRATADWTGHTPQQQLQLVRDTAHALARRHADTFRDLICPALRGAGLFLLGWAETTDDERASLERFFTDQVLPVLTPLAVDPAHPFPHISGLSLNLAVLLEDPETGDERFARVKLPPNLPRFVQLGGGRFIGLEDVLAAHLPTLFSGMHVRQVSVFRVTRDADIDIVDSEAENLLVAVERELNRRRAQDAVRLEIDETMSPRVLELLVRELDLVDDDVYRLPAPLDLTGLNEIADLDRPELHYPRFVPAVPPRVTERDGDLFAVLRRGALLVHHPYESFAGTVQRLVEQAAADPDVLAIKQTLYRTSGDSPIVDALIDAADAGKQVLVVVELKARFDERANIQWARALEQAGCHVVYGLVGLKTHAKLCLVVRQEGDRLRRYVHIGTGNYHPKTARLYEDFGLLTCDPVVGEDVADLFNHLSGYTRHRQFDRLLVAPDTLRSGLLRRIAREVANAQAGRPSGITFKVNNLVDDAIIDALYLASRAGVPIDLFVRGMCSLRPGVPELSETIRVRSVLGRFLEHSRVLRFCNDGETERWIGSADVMQRNLDGRVEALVRVTDPGAAARLDVTLDLAFRPDIACWELDADGHWRHNGGTVDYQAEMIQQVRRVVTAQS